MHYIHLIQLCLAIVSGVLLIGYGGMDDSPGAQGIGLLAIVTSLILVIAKIRGNHKRNT